MSILDILKTKLTARRAHTAGKYWETLSRIAAGTMTDRAAEAAVESLADLLPTLGKSGDDVERDLQLLEELADVEARADGMESATAAAKAAIKVLASANAKAEQLRAEAAAMVAGAERDAASARARASAIGAAKLELQAIRKRLANAGHPVRHQVSEDLKRAQLDQRIHQLEVDLGVVQCDLADLDRTIDRNRTPAKEMTAHRANLVAKRDQLEEQLVQARGDAAAEVGS